MFLHFSMILSGAFFFDKDYEKIKEDGIVPTYNWEAGDKFIPIAVGICKSILITRLILTVAYCKFPRVVILQFPLAIIMQTLLMTMPEQSTDAFSRVQAHSFLMFVMLIGISIDFLSSLACIILSALTVFLYIHPTFYTDCGNTPETVPMRVLFTIMIFFKVTGLFSLFTLLGNFATKNRE